MGKNILITGGAGFIGSKLAKSLKSIGHKVSILDNLSEQIHGKDLEVYESFLRQEYNFFKGSITDREVVRRALFDQEIIYHFAAETGTGQSMYQISHYCQTNIVGTAILLECISESPEKLEKVVLASSRSIYGEGLYSSTIYGKVCPEAREDDDMSEGLFEVKFKDDHSLKVLPTNESCIPKPNSIYAATKHAQEQLIQITCKSLGIPFYNLRFQNVYGPGQSLENPYTGILSIFSKRILKRKTLLVFEDGLESRDFIYIDDLVHILALCLTTNVEKACTINVGTGEATSILDVAKILRSAFDSDVPIQVTGNYRLGDIRHNFADINELIDVFGYQPKVTFNEGAEKFVEWVKKQRIGEDNLNDSLEEMREKGLLK